MTILRLRNRSALNVFGWFRCNVDVLPPHRAGGTPLGNYVLGNRTGLDTHALDIYLGLAPGELRVVDLSTAEDTGYDPLAGLDPNAVQLWGGIKVTLGGNALQFLGATANGAAFDGVWRGRVTDMLVAELHVSWYPDDPCRANGEIIITASNPSLPDVVREEIPWDMRLVFGDALVMIPGLQTDVPLMREGDWLADQQTRFLPLVLCWQRHTYAGDDPADLAEMCRAIADQKVSIRGIKNLHADGNPLLPAYFSAEQWSDEILPQVIERQHDWFNSPLDPAYVSGASGAQGAQSFVGGPAMADDPAGVNAIYLGGLDGSWPMFPLEQDGSQLDWRAHPTLRLYYGKVNVPISADKLGKSAWPTLADSHGYAGPEDEHWFDFTAFAAARLSGSAATQWHLRAHAIQFLHRWVTEAPGNWLSANRAIGWMGLLAAELFRGLADRELAAVVARRFQEVVDQLVIPQMLPGDAWWNWLNDPRIGASDTDLRAIVWQAEVMCVGMYLGGMACGHAPAVNLAHHMAEEIIRLGWFKRDDGYWVSRDYLAKNGQELTAYDGFRHFGMKACDVLLKRDPSHVAAGEIWRQRRAEAEGDLKALAWFLPGAEPTP
jgi:hypothetical protein